MTPPDLRASAVRTTPVDAVTEITEHEVLVDQPRDRIAAAPGYDPRLVDDRLHHENLYDCYGHRPFWNWRYTHPSGRFGRSGLGPGS